MKDLSGSQDKEEAAAEPVEGEGATRLQRSRGSLDIFTNFQNSAEPEGSESLTTVKKKGRMECAESGQLRSTSCGDVDAAAGPAGKKPS